MALLEELVARKEVGSSRAETIRYLVVTGLQDLVDRGRIGKERTP
jgi:fatty acid-binding protein DegV